MAKEVVRASLDRFEDDIAVVYADDGRKFDVPKRLIPRNTKAGSWLRIHLRDSEVTKVIAYHKDTEELEDKIKEKLERLKQNQHLE